jgi:hypothetical protein
MSRRKLAERAMMMHCNGNPIYLFLFWELRGLILNFHIHLSVSDFNIAHRHMNVEIGTVVTQYI